jgi:hypothetical protein
MIAIERSIDRPSTVSSDLDGRRGPRRAPNLRRACDRCRSEHVDVDVWKHGRMIRGGSLVGRVAAMMPRGLGTRIIERYDAGWPESLSIMAGAALLGAAACFAFSTRIPNVERLPAEVVFGFLGLYFYSAGFLSGRRTGKVGSGGWAGASCGLAFGAAVCGAMYVTARYEGVREAVRAGSLDQVAIAISGLVFFVALGALCGALGARGAVQARRQRS